MGLTAYCMQIPVAVASATPGDRLMESLQRAELAQYVAAVISGDDVQRGRPDPEPYLLASYDIKRPPARCVVIGASNASVEAASEIGMKCVAVATRLKVYELTAAHLVVRDLSDLKIQNLQQLFGAEEGRQPEFMVRHANCSNSDMIISILATVLPSISCKILKHSVTRLMM
jgi:beta-phosphoglucomutase-like phosphatase (HAD superfamily)